MSDFDSGIKPKLAIQRPDQPLEEYELIKSPVLVGRIKANDIVILGDSAISREHCRFDINPDDGSFSVRDLGSSNGTFVNGEQVGVDPEILKVGDLIQVGATVMTYSVDRPSQGAIVRQVRQRLFNAPMAPKKGEDEAVRFGEDFCVCGRCGNTISTGGLGGGDKVGCPNCRAVWTLPA